jgi:hypothetical protein
LPWRQQKWLAREESILRDAAHQIEQGSVSQHPAKNAWLVIAIDMFRDAWIIWVEVKQVEVIFAKLRTAV